MKYFIVSDIHSFFKQCISALNKAGYDKDNPNHTLVVIGDLFDRGFETLKLFEFINSIPKDRLVLIRGNHEDLYENLLKKKFPQNHDVNNGTVRTFFAQAPNYKEEDIFFWKWYEKEVEECGGYSGLYDNRPQETWDYVKDIVSKSEITKLIQDKSIWVNYYEIGPYILTHSFIPTIGQYEYDCFKPTTYNEDWRNSSEKEFADARWGCPWYHYKQGCWDKEAEKGKILVCGHWHTSDFYSHLEVKNKPKSESSIFYSKNLIAIDGGCRSIVCKSKKGKIFYKLHHPQNVLIIDENFDCYDKNGNKLNEDK